MAKINATRIKNDVNGNPRYVVHFLDLLTEEEKNSSFLSWIDAKYSLALQRAACAGGKKFHNKRYGGGVVYQSYAGIDKEVRDSFELFEQSKDYINAKNNIQLVVFNSFNEYTEVMEAMKALKSGKEKDYRKTWATIYSVCNRVAEDMKKRFKIRMSYNAVWLGAVFVALEAEESVNNM